MAMIIAVVAQKQQLIIAVVAHWPLLLSNPFSARASVQTLGSYSGVGVRLWWVVAVVVVAVVVVVIVVVVVVVVVVIVVVVVVAVVVVVVVVVFDFVRYIWISFLRSGFQFWFFPRFSVHSTGWFVV